MPQGAELLISCHCGAAKQTVVLLRAQPGGPSDVDICHCHACRHGTGLLSVSYAPIQTPSSLGGLVSYLDNSSPHAPPAGTLHRYFCGTCGCHVFRHGASSAPVGGEDKKNTGSWEVATGVIVGRANADSATTTQVGEVKVGGEREDEEEPLLKFARHVNTASTGDGGLSPFITHVDGSELEVHKNSSEPSSSVPPLTGERKADGDVLEAHCRCKTIRFRITRPNAASRLPRSGFPDLTVPFATSPREIVGNPHDEKWWLRPEGGGSARPTKYLAGTCACRSCRLTAGFEVQTWAFVPRSNIFFHPPLSSSAAASTTTTTSPTAPSPSTSKPIPLDFATLRQQGVPLQSYDSSPGVRREFCPSCGATVFWHDRWRPDLVDVSAGLLDAAEGARAEGWLEWWRGRVSFEEEAGNGRTGEVARVAKELMGGLAEGLGRWKDGKVDEG
ncbi:Dolichyl-phosphate-mannose--protein mannosyltransferase 1 [Hypoxylon texense]